jgi:hypothetical protein
MKKLALAEAEEATKQARKLAEAEAEKKALHDQFTKPSGLSDEEAIQRAIKIIERAVSNSRTEVQVAPFMSCGPSHTAGEPHQSEDGQPAETAERRFRDWRSRPARRHGARLRGRQGPIHDCRG